MFTKSKIIFAVCIFTALFAGGCLVSGTFTIIENLSFTTQTGFYHAEINLTTNEDWEEHVANINDVELVGFELWITNNESSEWTYEGYADNYDSNCVTQGCFDSSTTKFQVLKQITIPASTGNTGSEKFISYAESFNYLDNIETLRALVLTGQFNVYGLATGGSGGQGGVIDSLKIVITINASDNE